MSVLKQYLTRKGFNHQRIRQAIETGQADVPPNWTNYFVNDDLLFSHRCNQYTGKQYGGDELHTHGYYEILIHVHGDVEYIQNNRHIHPQPYTVLWCRPGTMHALRVSSCEYERYLMYFSPKFFSQSDKQDYAPILMFGENSDIFAFRAEKEYAHLLQSFLDRIEETLQSDLPYKSLLAKALIIELFASFNTNGLHQLESQSLNDPIADIKRYIDRNYAEITGLDEVARDFHYSREHLSRKFKNRFGTSLSEYLSRRRILESTHLLAHMKITDACYAVGFQSQSVYISAFKKIMGCLPSEYKKQLEKTSGPSPYAVDIETKSGMTSP